MEGATVGLRSSSFWQGEPICESGAQLGFDPTTGRLSAFRCRFGCRCSAPQLRDGCAPFATHPQGRDPVRLIPKGNLEGLTGDYSTAPRCRRSQKKRIVR
jgi:hypothetical protein